VPGSNEISCHCAGHLSNQLTTPFHPVPDFRSPDTGLYANLAALGLPEPEAVFDLSFFRMDPRPFYALARDLYPGARYRPTISHVFISLLARKGLLHMLFTQNIDCLEREAGIPPDRIIEAHGSFATQRCIDCKREFDGDKMRKFVARGEVPRCEGPRLGSLPPKSTDGSDDAAAHPDDDDDDDDARCGGFVKPDIVFFGEALPRHFFTSMHLVEEADLVLVMGTSLQVRPFANLPGMAPARAPRVLFNMERVGNFGTRADDVVVLGDCDAGVRRLADLLGWRDELEKTWRDLVGEEEAEKQLRGRTKREEALREEVTKLAEDVEQVLREEGEVAALALEVETSLHIDDQADVPKPDAGPAKDGAGKEGTGTEGRPDQEANTSAAFEPHTTSEDGSKEKADAPEPKKEAVP
jgi:NAD-dependent histone deacetylase SIR2